VVRTLLASFVKSGSRHEEAALLAESETVIEDCPDNGRIPPWATRARAIAEFWWRP